MYVDYSENLSRCQNAMSSYPLICNELQHKVLPITAIEEKVDDWDAKNQAKMERLASSGRPFQEIYDEFRVMREKERKEMESRGLVDRQNVRKNLSEALAFQGSCHTMCPAVERVRRSIERNVSSIEKDETGKISGERAVKAFSRPAAGQPPPLPSDVRPPRVLLQTLKYLVDTALPQLPSLHNFLWDRTRSIRQDFTYQNYGGIEAIQCCEVIARIHIVSLHIMAGYPGEYSRQQELEQFNKTLQTLNDLYALYPNRKLDDFPFEPEMRAYQLLSRLSDPSLDYLSVPSYVARHPIVMLARQLRSMVRSFHITALINKLFRVISEQNIPPLIQCVMEIHFNQLRVVAVRQLWRSLHTRNGKYPEDRFREYLSFDNIEETRAFCDHHKLIISEGDVDIRTWNESAYRDRSPLAQPCSSWIRINVGPGLQDIVWPKQMNVKVDLPDGGAFRSNATENSLKAVTLPENKQAKEQKLRNAESDRQKLLREQEKERIETEKKRLLEERLRLEQHKEQRKQNERKQEILRQNSARRAKRHEFITAAVNKTCNQLFRDVILHDTRQIILSERLNKKRTRNIVKWCVKEILERVRRHRGRVTEEHSFIQGLSSRISSQPKVSDLWTKRRSQSLSTPSQTEVSETSDPWSGTELEQAIKHARSLGVFEASLRLPSTAQFHRKLAGFNITPKAPFVVDATQAESEEEAAAILCERLKSIADKTPSSSENQEAGKKRQRLSENDSTKYYSSLRRQRLRSINPSIFLSSGDEPHSVSNASPDTVIHADAVHAPASQSIRDSSSESVQQQRPKRRKHSGPLARLKELIARSYDLM